MKETTTYFIVIAVFLSAGFLPAMSAFTTQINVNLNNTNQENFLFAIEANVSMSVHFEVHSHNYTLEQLKITPPRGSAVRQTTFPLTWETDYFTPRIRPIVGSTYPSKDWGFALGPVWMSDEGTWTLEVQGGGRDPVVSTWELRVVDANVASEVHPKEVKIREGDTTNLYLILPAKDLRFDNDYRLLSCSVIHPNGTEISLTPNSTTNGNSSRFEYSTSCSGDECQSLQNGHCSAAIKNINHLDSGKWQLKAVHNSSQIIITGESVITVTDGPDNTCRSLVTTLVLLCTLISIILIITICVLIKNCLHYRNVLQSKA